MPHSKAMPRAQPAAARPSTDPCTLGRLPAATGTTVAVAVSVEAAATRRS